MEFGWWNLDFAFFHLCEKVLTNVGRSKQLPISSTDCCTDTQESMLNKGFGFHITAVDYSVVYSRKRSKILMEFGCHGSGYYKFLLMKHT